ncbi:MAG: class I SAM-dependent methyltransferase [Nocardioides sp.]
MRAGSPSLLHPDYWWYQARARQLAAFFGPYVRAGDLMLDVGSADGPSVSWLDESVRRIPLDRDPRGVPPGLGVGADVMQLPFRDSTFDVVSAFDVLEHCEPEASALAEVSRVLRPGGRILLAVPAYEWAWSSHDVHNSHRRRYTRARLERAVSRAGLQVERSSYAFSSVFPLFAAQRLASRARERLVRAPAAHAQDVVTVPRLPASCQRLLLGVSGLDRRLLSRVDLPFGSSVFTAAVKKG